jgi:adenosylhomocysteine nucleosidase
MSYRIGVIAALAGELKPLVRGWVQQADGAYLIQDGDVAAVAVARGMGKERAEQAVLAAESYGPMDTLVSIGWAGGSSCGVQPGTAYEVGEVIDQTTGERFVTASDTNPLKLVTADHIVGREEKRKLAEGFGASLVDMEAAAVARMAHQRGISFFCWKAITDIASEELPDLNLFLDREKQLRMGQLATYAVTRPHHIASLWRMGRNSRTGAQALAETVRHWIHRH